MKAPKSDKQKSPVQSDYLKSLLDHVADPIFVKNRKHQWIDGNKAFWELMGGPRENFEGKSDYDIFPKEEADNFWEQDDKIFETRQPSSNEEFLTDSKGIRHIISTKKVLFTNDEGEDVLVGIIRDITSQRQLEEINTRMANEAAKETEVRLRAIHNQAAIGFAQSDLSDRIISVNPRFCEILGRSEEELLGARPSELTYHEDKKANSILLEYLIRTGKPFNIEKRYVKPDGSIVWVSNDVSMISRPNAEPWLIMRVVQDITERKFALEALRHKEQQYQNIFKSSKDAIIIFDENGKVVEVNPEASRIYDYSYDELMKMTGIDFAPAENAPKFDNFVKTAKAGKIYFTESLHKRKDSTPVHVEINGSGVNFDGKFHIMAIIRDITERKRVAEAFDNLTGESERLKRLYETALSNTADFNYLLDLNGRFTYINKPLQELWEISLPDIIGKNFFDIGYVPEVAEMIQKEIKQVIETKQSIRGQNSYSDASGPRTYEYIFQPVLAASGEVTAVAGSTRDISELLQANKRKDEFIAILAHELRNPLAPIRNSLEIIKRTDDKKIHDEVHATIERQLEHMVHLIDDLMDVSRINQNKIELRLENISLREVINHAVETADPLIKERHHDLKINMPANEIYLNADFSRVSQIFSNLLTNSAKYTDVNGKIIVDVKLDDEKVAVTVSDNGIGISPEMMPKIFDMFSQVDSSLERTQGGLGIGLTLVKNMVEMHGGSVEVTSGGNGKGSEFTIILPVSEVAVKPNEKQAEMETENSAVLRVLIVDDNEASAKTMGWAMELSGHDTKLLHDGVNVVETAKEYKPNVIMLDIGLPGMNGYEVCEALRAVPEFKNTTIIAQTGWGQKEHLERSKLAGFDHHLVKPVDIKQLQKLISSISANDK